MNLVYYDLNLEIKLEIKKLNFLIIEHPVQLEKFVISLHSVKNKLRENIAIFEKIEKVNFSKNVDLLFSPIEISYSKKEIQKKLIEYLLSEIENSDLQEEVINSTSNLLSLADKIKFEVEYPIDYSDCLKAEDILKLMDIHLTELEGRFVERLIDYSKTVYELMGRKLFILVGCSGYMTEDDFEYLYNHQCSLEIMFLFIENHQIDLKLCKKESIIDIDLCEI